MDLKEHIKVARALNFALNAALTICFIYYICAEDIKKDVPFNFI